MDRVERLSRENSAFQENIFTFEELRYSLKKRFPFERLAARFAAKEAFFKALGTGLSGHLDWRDVEVRNERSGKPGLLISGETATRADGMGMVASYLSLSHTAKHAVALVIIEIDPQSR